MERSAGPAGAKAPRDGFPDGWFQEAAIPAQLPSDANPEVRSAWDAWADARLDAAADALHPDRLGADAGKWVVPEPDVPALRGSHLGDSQSAVLA